MVCFQKTISESDHMKVQSTKIQTRFVKIRVILTKIYFSFLCYIQTWHINNLILTTSSLTTTSSFITWQLRLTARPSSKPIIHINVMTYVCVIVCRKSQQAQRYTNTQPLSRNNLSNNLRNRRTYKPNPKFIATRTSFT